MCQCVEDDPPSSFLGRRKDNCAKTDRSKVPSWAMLGTQGCSSTTRDISVDDLEETEKKAAAFQKGYDEFWSAITRRRTCPETAANHGAGSLRTR
eukprot:CAMPEP_0180664802 /NCGR_PEP_ID=MMETSP1037_2-20121125/60883_1 /TAXON_ID=632150 /ORGANISM="Azadinium spinosum, Strain 3D9" /LENGTH=94 /DNA_ID=CAMNT_0022693083 /DNA_START=178 /DNA_END=462 /DNA_ORIENTATION=+